jgi:hypothetical protein
MELKGIVPAAFRANSTAIAACSTPVDVSDEVQKAAFSTEEGGLSPEDDLSPELERRTGGNFLAAANHSTTPDAVLAIGVVRR